MDRGKRSGNLVIPRNNKMYLDLKNIIRENALPFLPAKSLFRFLSICRDWKLQISTPFFAHNQSISCNSVLGFFCQSRDESPSLISIDPDACGVPDPSLSFLPELVEIRSSTNGLLCCQGKGEGKAYYICNPALKQYRKLPKPNADHGSQPAIVLAFEPSVLNFEVDYKVVCAFASSDFDDATEFEIYSSKEGTWKISGEMCFADLHIDKNSGVYANGVVYWRGTTILAYDLAKDRSQLLREYYHHVSVLGTRLGELYSASTNNGMLTVSVLANVHWNTMQMNSHSQMWREIIKVKIDELVGVPVSGCTVYSVGGDFIVLGNSQSLHYYDIQKKEHKALTAECNYCNSVWLPYLNSLASLEF